MTIAPYTDISCPYCQTFITSRYGWYKETPPLFKFGPIFIECRGCSKPLITGAKPWSSATKKEIPFHIIKILLNCLLWGTTYIMLLIIPSVLLALYLAPVEGQPSKPFLGTLIIISFAWGFLKRLKLEIRRLSSSSKSHIPLHENF